MEDGSSREFKTCPSPPLGDLRFYKTYHWTHLRATLFESAPSYVSFKIHFGVILYLGKYGICTLDRVCCLSGPTTSCQLS